MPIWYDMRVLFGTNVRPRLPKGSDELEELRFQPEEMAEWSFIMTFPVSLSLLWFSFFLRTAVTPPLPFKNSKQHPIKVKSTHLNICPGAD